MEIDLEQTWYHFYQMAITFLLSLPIAVNREQKSQGAGLRTFPLVGIASCAFMLVGQNVYPDAEPQARIMYGVITGMGFIGGGSIFVKEGHSSGTATAAGIWLTGAIGISVAYNIYEIAIVLSLVGFVLLQFSTPFKKSA